MIQITFTRGGVSGISKKQLRRVGAAAIGKAAEYWVRHYLKLHFMQTARHRYNYKARGTRYRRSKKRRAKGPDGINAIGQDLPLVFSGRTRESVMKGNSIKATGSNYINYKAVVTLPAPALNRDPRLRDELIRINSQELRKLETVFQSAYETELNKVGRTVRKTKTYKAAA